MKLTPSSDDGVKRPRKRARSPQQTQRNEATRHRLLEAAGNVIGRYGYAGCTIARVTTKAKMAHGTFYLHFQSQQDLFDTVLPVLGSEMLQHIGRALHECKDVIEMERQGFKANFEYLSGHPYMYRLLSEAELFAPNAFKEYFDRQTEAYARSLHRSGVVGFEDRELESVAAMLIGARTYLLLRHGMANRSVKPMPNEKMEIYLNFVTNGLTRGRA